MNTITEMGARIMCQQLTRSFVSATPLDESSNEWCARALKLQAGLGRVLGVMPSSDDIEELVTTYEELESVDAGTHPELRTSINGTMDNTPEITDYLLGRVERETTALLRNAGFGKKAAA